MQDQTLVSLDEKDTRAAGRIENDLVALLQTVEAFPAQRLFQHKADEEWRRIDGAVAVFYEDLVDVAD
jgi:hypothetical protein